MGGTRLDWRRKERALGISSKMPCGTGVAFLPLQSDGMMIGVLSRLTSIDPFSCCESTYYSLDPACSLFTQVRYRMTGNCDATLTEEEKGILNPEPRSW